MYEDTYKLIAARIVEAMEKRDLSYGELASLTDIPKSTLQRYATGDTRKIPLDRIEAIARETNTSTAYLMGWNETEKSPAPEGTEDEEKVQAVVSGLTRLLVEVGWIAPGADLTDAQLRTLASYVIALNFYFKGEL